MRRHNHRIVSDGRAKVIEKTPGADFPQAGLGEQALNLDTGAGGEANGSRGDYLGCRVLHALRLSQDGLESAQRAFDSRDGEALQCGGFASKVVASVDAFG